MKGLTLKELLKSIDRFSKKKGKKYDRMRAEALDYWLNWSKRK